MNKKIINLLVGIALVVLGIVLIIMHFNNKAKLTAEVTAKVIRVDSELEYDTDGFETRYYTPIIEYTADNKTYENRLSTRTTNSVEYKIGDSIVINYNPENPNEFQQKGSLAFIIGGAIAILVGAVAIVSYFKM